MEAREEEAAIGEDAMRELEKHVRFKKNVSESDRGRFLFNNREFPIGDNLLLK